MATYLRVQDGLAVEEWSEPDGAKIDQCFTADLIGSFQLKGSAEIGWAWNGSKFTKAAVATVSKADLVAYAAIKRFTVETSGYVFNGHPISTDRDSQSKVGSIALAANIIGASFSAEWKCSDGTFFTLDHDDAISMATAVMIFVSTCFATEASVVSAIAAGTTKTMADIDASSWPANS